MESFDNHFNCNQNSLVTEDNFTTSDSGLETITSGALPECTGSPKDQSTSETSGRDLTECTLQDVMPLDETCSCSNDQGFFDSSLSSQELINLHLRPPELKDFGMPLMPPSKVPCKNDEQQSWIFEKDIRKHNNTFHHHSQCSDKIQSLFRCDKEIRDDCDTFLEWQCLSRSKDMKTDDDKRGELFRDRCCNMLFASQSDSLSHVPEKNRFIETSPATQSGRLNEHSMDSSESNADSLEHENIDPIQKDLSPTIFELDPDSLSHTTKPNKEYLDKKDQISKSEDSQLSDMNIVLSGTPTNSIMQVIERDSDDTTNLATTQATESNEPLLLPESPTAWMAKKAKYTKHDSTDRTSRTNISPAWVVDMSTPKHVENSAISPKIQPTVVNSLVTRQLFNECVSRSSLESDSSERSSKKSMGFYVDLSSMPDVAVEKEVQENLVEKKNIFSMYIELEDNSNVKEMPQNLSSSLNAKKILSSKSLHTSRNLSLVNCNIETTNSVPEVLSDVQCKETISQSSSEKELPITPSIVLRRRKDNFKSNNNRHSWNAMGSVGDGPQQLKVSQKRTQSFNLGSSDINIAKLKDKDCVSGISPIDDNTYSKSEISSFSGSSDSRRQSESYSLPAIADDEHLHLYKDAGAVISDGNVNVAYHKKRHQDEAKINETFENISTCSTENDFSKDTASTITDENDITCQFDSKSELKDKKLSEKKTNVVESFSQLIAVMENNDSNSTAVFEEVEKLCEKGVDKEGKAWNIGVIISVMENQQLKKIQERTNKERKTEFDNRMKNLQAVIDKQKQNLVDFEIFADEQLERDDVFVRLSDLDKALPNISLDSAREHISSDGRMTRSIPKPTCKGQNKSAMSRSMEVFTSFHSENTVSLSRLFPHLKKEFSRSDPNSLGTRPASNSLRTDDQSDISEISSIQSSTCQSKIEGSTTDDTSQSWYGLNNTPNQIRLGEDLLRMFLEEIAPDVTVKVDGRRVKAHKCILSSRCQYFAAILSGGWVESSGNVITLSGFSYNVVHFALRHIYSGASTIPDSIGIMELAALTDMLGLEGLKEVIMYKLKVKYCHMFHKPCSLCTAGVLQSLPISAAYGLDQVYLNSIRWITKYFVCIWPTELFATLPKQLIEKCYQEQVVYMSVDNVLVTVSGCGRVLSEIAKMPWGNSVRRVCERLISTATRFISSRFMRVLHTSIQGSVPGDALVGVGLEAVENCLMAAYEMAPAEQMGLAYQWLFDLNKQRPQRESMVRSASSDNISAALITTELGKHLIPGTELEWRLVERWMLQCEGRLVRNIAAVSHTRAWSQLDTNLRRRLKQSAGFVLGRLDSSTKTSIEKSQVNIRSKHGIIKPSLPSGYNRSAQNEHILVAKLDNKGSQRQQGELIHAPFGLQSPRAINKKTVPVQIPNLVRAPRLSQTVPRALSNPPAPVQQRKKPKTDFDETKIKSKIQKNVSSKLKKYDNVLPRYLEPRPNRETKASNTSLNLSKPNLSSKKVSSSESSRNSTPGFAVHSRTESKKDIKGSNAKIREAPREKSSSESSPVRTSTLCLSNPTKYHTSNAKHSQDGKYNLKTANMLKQTGIVGSPRISRPKTRSLSTTKENRMSQNDLSTSKLLLQRDASVPFTLKSSKYESTTSLPAKQNNKRTPVNPLKPTLPGTLMKATKSSSAKMVAKIANSNQKLSNSQCYNNVNSNISQEVNGDIQDENISKIPVMERSGTFLKEELSFVGKSGAIATID